MAWLRNLVHICDEHGCFNTAVGEVMNSRNEAMGRYCRRHAEKRLREIEKAERADASDLH
jgi:hypothetical protein